MPGAGPTTCRRFASSDAPAGGVSRYGARAARLAPHGGRNYTDNTFPRRTGARADRDQTSTGAARRDGGQSWNRAFAQHHHGSRPPPVFRSSTVASAMPLRPAQSSGTSSCYGYLMSNHVPRNKTTALAARRAQLGAARSTRPRPRTSVTAEMPRRDLRAQHRASDGISASTRLFLAHVLVAPTSRHRLSGHSLAFCIQYAAGMHAAVSSLNHTLIMPGSNWTSTWFDSHAAGRSFVCPCPAVYAL